MKSLDQRIEEYISKGFTLVQARYKTAQEIILSKIEKTNYIDKVLLKGGIVMYNITQERRRTTSDLDLDFIRFDISKEQNIQKFIEALNKKEPTFHIKLESMKDLHQDDYKGKKLSLLLSDDYNSSPITFTIDVGVHTLLGIEQEKMSFAFEDGKTITLWVNPPEQMFAEKLFSLAKIGPDSTRYKDIDDMYYLIVNSYIDLKVLRQCLSLLVIGNIHGFKDISDIVEKVDSCLNNELFKTGFLENKNLWLDVDYSTIRNTIIDYIYRI